MNFQTGSTPTEEGSIKMEDLRDDDELYVVCNACGYKISMTSAQAKAVARPYRTLSDFGKMSGCGYCRKVGLDVRLTSEKSVE